MAKGKKRNDREVLNKSTALKREDNLTKEKLLAEIERLKKELKKKKKYGLVWE